MSQIVKAGTGGGGGGIIDMIDGDIGSITGSSVTIFANNASNLTGGSVLFNNSGTTSTLTLTDSNNNIFIGKGAGKTSPSAGTGANIGIGFETLMLADGAQENTATGFSCMVNLTSGSRNLAYGASAGESYTTESNNICIAHPGETGDSGVIRIGLQGPGTARQTEAFMAGIVGNTVSNQELVTINSMTGQLGVTTSVSFSVGMTTDQTLAQNALNTVVYDTPIVDTASGYSAGVYTVPAGGAGNWFISVVANFATSTSFTDCDIFVNKNSGTFLFHLEPSTPSDGITTNNGSGSGIFPLVAGDTLQIQQFAQTVGSTTLTAAGASNGYLNVFSAYKLP